MKLMKKQLISILTASAMSLSMMSVPMVVSAEGETTSDTSSSAEGGEGSGSTGGTESTEGGSGSGTSSDPTSGEGGSTGTGSGETGGTSGSGTTTPAVHVHNLIAVPAKAASCVSDGNKAYWQCASCNKLFEDAAGTKEITAADVVIPKSHKMTHTAAVDATCLKGGNVEYYHCSVCGIYSSDEAGTSPLSESDLYTSATGHDFSSPAYNKNNTDDNYHWAICADCGAADTKKMHNWGSGTVTKAATCDEEGEETFTCSVCGKTKTESIPKTDHNFSTTYSKNKTSHWLECSTCHEKKNVGAHVKDAGEITTEPTKTSDGERTFKCKVCGEPMGTEIIKKLDEDHDHVGEAISTKFDSTGHWQEYACGVVVSSKASHTLVDQITKKATCTSEGIKTKKCVCGYTETEVIPKTSHNEVYIDAVAATCEKAGSTAGKKCKDCGTVTVKPQIIPMLDHTYTGWESNASSHWHKCTTCKKNVDEAAHINDGGKITKAPTASTKGEKTYSCTVCGYVIAKKEVSVLDVDHEHSFSTSWKTDTTSHWHECDCGEKKDTAVHTMDAGTVTIPATKTSTGVKTYKCSVCGYVMKTETIPALDNTDPVDPDKPEHKHSYGSVWHSDSYGHWLVCSCGDKSNYAAHVSDGGYVTVAPTYNTYGRRVYKCYVCGEVLRTESIAPTGYYYSAPPVSSYLPYYYSYYNPYYYYYSGNTNKNYSSSRALKVDSSSVVNEKGITISWEGVRGAKKYSVYRYSESTGKYTKLKDTTSTSYTMSNPRNGMTYKFMIKYTTGGRLSADALSGKITVTANFKPIVKASAGKTQIKLSWQSVKGAEKYAVYRYKDGKGSKITETEDTTAVIKNLKSGREYSYVVRAYVDGKWTSMTKSDIVTARTKE